MYRPFSIILVILNSAVLLAAQTNAPDYQNLFRFDNLKVENGLPSPTVIDIARDSRGFVWFYSTRDIVRYDGFEFRCYPFHGTVHDLSRFGTDQRGNLYTTDGQSLFRYNSVEDGFDTIPLPIPLGRPEAICFLHTGNPDGTVWFRHGDRLYRIRSPDNPPALVSDRLLPSDRFVGMVSRDGEAWLSSVKNVDQSVRLQQANSAGNDHIEVEIPTFIHSIYEDEARVLWMGSWTKGLWRYDLNTKDTRRFDSPSADNHIYGVIQLPEWTGLDIFWLNSRISGLYLFDRKSSQFVANIRSVESQKQSLAATDVYNFRYDSENILWLGTPTGVSMMHPRKQRIRQIHLHQPKDEYLTLPIVSATPRPPEELFMLFREDDIRLYDPAKRFWRTINKAAHGLREQKAGHYFRACYDSNGQLWLTTPTGLFQVDQKRGRVTRKVAGLSQDKWRFGAICPTSDGKIYWYDQYLRCYDTRTGKSKTFFHRPDSNGLMPDEGVVAILPAQDGNLWLAAWDAVVKFNPANLQLERFKLHKFPNAEKFGSTILRVAVAGDSALWISATTGLIRLDLHTRKQAVFYPSGDSTAQFSGGGLALDRFGNIWAGDHHSIYRMDAKSRQFTEVNQRDGFSSNVLYGLTVNGGKILANRYLGVVDEINPDIFQLPQPALPAYITDVYFGAERLPVQIDQTESAPYHFVGREHAITIHYTAIDFDQAHKARFAYRLEPFDKDWVDAGGDRSATYTNLEGGTYTFRVRVVNGDGIISEVSKPLCFFVPLIWYRTWWFYSLFILAVGAFFYFIFRYREIRRLEQEKLRLRIARDLHDEMGSTLSSISILSEAALRNLQTDIDRARFGTIGDRTRQVMDAMSDIVWSVNPGNDNMENVLQRMKEFAVEILEAREIQVHFEADETVKRLKLPMEKRKDFYLLFKEAINNAAKYSGASHVWVMVRVVQNNLALEVRDNGCGFDPGTVKRGNGLWSMQARAERMGGKLQIISSLSEGTCVRMSHIT